MTPSSSSSPGPLNDGHQQDQDEIPLVRRWLSKLTDAGIKFHTINIKALVMFGERVGFALVEVMVEGVATPVSVFLRGDSVAILVHFRYKGEKYGMLVRQARIPIADMGWVEIPAGMLDGSGDFAGKAAAELYEECGFKITQSMLKPLGNPDGYALSPGACDERIKLYHVDLGVIEEEEQFNSLHGHYGLAEEGESTDCFSAPFKDLLASGDAKTSLAVLLYLTGSWEIW